MTILTAARIPSADLAGPREIVFRTRGTTQGSITRLASPSDLGQMLKPFVFLDLFAADPARVPMFGWHPHSGIATLTVILAGQAAYEETTGVKGVLSAGGIEWMQAGGGVWHTAGAAGTQRVTGFQLWLALPPALENAPPQSQYLAAADVQNDGPARVVLGQSGGAVSPIRAPSGINYLDVRLQPGERWTYEPPAGHTVGWMAVETGTVQTPEPVTAGELAVFAAGDAAIHFEAPQGARFVLGSAIPHPHDLVLGYYSVHTSRAALMKGEAEIERIGHGLQAAGKLN